MKTTARLIFAGAIILAQALGASLALAAQTFSACDVGAVVYYINGVSLSAEQSASYTAKKLEQELAHFSVQGVKDVTSLINPSDGAILDVLSELAAQKSAERNVAFADIFVQVGLAAWGHVSSLSQADQDQIRATVAAVIGTSRLSSTTASKVNQFRDTVVSTLQNGNKTILVSHSQGNMFANEVYDAVRANVPQETYQGLAVVNVANPAARAPNGLYVTVHEDLVINRLATGQVYIPILNGNLLMPNLSPLPSNFNASGALSKDSLGHGFIKVYLARDLPTGSPESASVAAKVTSLISQSLAIAQAPNRTTTDGPLTATLTWQGVGDMDLHVFEPQGSYVYFAATQGADGYLDLDNTYGYGPEHYYTSCAGFAEGTYQFGARYFGGRDPQTVTLTIQTPSGTQSSTWIFQQAVGTSAEPFWIYGVTVTRQPDGLYSFSVDQYQS